MSKTKRKRPRPGMRRAVVDAIAKGNARNAHPYDGVYGLPPRWLPEPLLQQFLSTRDELLDRYSGDDVQQWLKIYQEVITDARSIPICPTDVLRDVQSLAYIHWIVGRGETDGVQAYLGPGEHRALRGTFIDEHDRARQLDMTKKSAESRRERTAERYRCIHDVHAANPTEKLAVIAHKLRISIPTVYRALKQPRP